MTDYRSLIEALVRSQVEFILVGGVAATIHGSARLTYNVDVVYARSEENLARIATALAQHGPYLRGAPQGLPFELDKATLRGGLNFTLTTSIGDLALLGEIAGGGNYEDLSPHSQQFEVFGFAVRCLDMETLRRVKRAAGRPKDLEAIAELEALREESE